MTDSSWLVVIDMQQAFADPVSRWAVDGFAAITPVVQQLVDAFPGRVVFTRFVRDPAEDGQWAAYYDTWPEFRVTSEDGAWTLVVPPRDAPVVDEPTFTKWGAALQRVVGDAPLVLCGVATECCVLATAFGAADAGHRVEVVADGCAGASTASHGRALEIMHANAPLITVVTGADVLARRDVRHGAAR